MASIFSHPAFFVGGNYRLVGYNLSKSPAIAGAPQFFGPWTPVATYQRYTTNRDIVDVTGTYYDLYRVQPIVNATLPDGTSVEVFLDFSRPFYSWQPLYDMQISQLLDTFRQNWTADVSIPVTESTSATETSGGNIMPFVSDPETSRFYLSFLPNDDPIKLIAESCRVTTGATKGTAAPLVPYIDFFPSEDGGFIDFATIPPASAYVRVEYAKVGKTNDQLRNALLNAVSSLSLYGINGYEVKTSNNLYYLENALPNRDIGDLLCELAFRNLLNSEFLSSLAASEAWKDGRVEWAADPGRALQAAAGRVTDLEEDIRLRSNRYIVNTREYISRGEFDSYFDVSGVLPIYTLIVAGANTSGAIGWWL